MIDRPAIFQSIFGKDWEKLPPVMHKHYANRPYTNDVVVAEGVMQVRMHWLVKCLSPLMRLTGTLAPEEGEHIPVTVRFLSEPDSACYCFERIFQLKNGRTHRFFSRMEPVGSNKMVEWTRSGIGWHCAYSFENDKVMLWHRGYSFRIGNKIISLPGKWLFGECNASEWAESESVLHMQATIRHPLFGDIYYYGGRFEITEMQIKT